MPGQRPCQPHPPALPFLAPPAHVRAEPAPAADPAVNPEQISDPVVLSPLRATPEVLNASRVGTLAPEDAPEAARARGSGCPGPLSLPVPSPRTHLGGMSEAPGPAAGGSRGDVAALPSARRAPGRSVLPVRPPRVLVASQPRRAFRTLLSGAARASRLCCNYGATSRQHGALRGTATTSLPRTWAGGLADAQLDPGRGAIRKITLPDCPPGDPSPGRKSHTHPGVLC